MSEQTKQSETDAGFISAPTLQEAMSAPDPFAPHVHSGYEVIHHRHPCIVCAAIEIEKLQSELTSLRQAADKMKDALENVRLGIIWRIDPSPKGTHAVDAVQMESWRNEIEQAIAQFDKVKGGKNE